MGIGCLYERVENEKTGFVAKNIKEFIEYTNLILRDNSIYFRLRDNLLQKRNSRNYTHVKENLIKLLKRND